MNSIQPQFSWNTPKGQLSVTNNEGEYQFTLLKNSNEKVNVVCSDNFKLMKEDQINAICKEVIPIIRKDKNSHEYSVIFYPSSHPGKKEEVQQNKSFGFTFNKLENVFFLNFSPTAPSYRRAVQGVNLEGQCLQKTCDAFEQFVIIPLGMGKFNVAKQTTRTFCPVCNTKLNANKITNLGFWNCKYKVSGVKLDSEIVKKEDSAPSDRYKTFKHEDNCAWTFLEVKAEAIPSTNTGCTIF